MKIFEVSSSPAKREERVEPEAHLVRSKNTKKGLLLKKSKPIILREMECVIDKLCNSYETYICNCLYTLVFLLTRLAKVKLNYYGEIFSFIMSW